MEIDVNSLILIFAIASIVAIIAKQIRFPYTITLVIAGIAVAVFGLQAPFELGYDLIFHILLPPLLFEGALHMRLSYLLDNMKLILLLILPGLLGSVFLVAFLLNIMFPAIPFIFMLLLAAIVIPTDPATILAFYKEMKVPHKLRSIVEGESVFDDGLAIVFWSVIIMVITESALGGSGTVLVEGHHILLGIGQFMKLSFLGLVIGGVMGYLAYLIIRKINDKFTEIMITVILAFGIFAFSEFMGGSGVFAVVIAGLILGNYGTRFAMAPSTRMSLISFWSFLAFAVNSFLFILIGMSVNWSDIWTNIGLIIITILFLWMARALMIFLTGKIVNRDENTLSKKWQMIMWWGGLRGAIPIAMALSIPSYLVFIASGDPGNILFPHRDTILAVTFGVVLGTLLIQGLTLRPLLKKLGFYASTQKEAEQEEKEISVLLRDSMDELSTLRDDDELSNKSYEILISRYSQANSQLLTELGMMVNEHGFVPKDEYSFAVKEALEAKKDAVKDTWEKGIIPGATGEKLITELDEQIRHLSVDLVDTPKTASEVLRSVARPANGNNKMWERTCGICLQPMELDEPHRSCRCGTVFHNSCIKDIERCPICIAVLDDNSQVPAGSEPTYDLERNI